MQSPLELAEPEIGVRAEPGPAQGLSHREGGGDLVLGKRNDHIIDFRSQFGQQAHLRQQFQDHHVSEPEPDGRNRIASKGGKQGVITPAAANGPQFAPGIADFEYRSGVIGEPPHHGDVELAIAAEPHGLQGFHQPPHLPERTGESRLPGMSGVSQRFADLLQGFHAQKIVEPRNLFRFQPQFAQLGVQGLAGYLVALVHHHHHRQVERLGHPDMLQDGVQNTPVVEVHPDLLRGEPHLLQGHQQHRQHLHFGCLAGLSHHVGVPLVVLPLAAAGHPLVAEALGDGEPLEGEGERVLSLQHQPRQRWGHLGAQGQPAAALVVEGVQLLRDLVTRLADV